MRVASKVLYADFYHCECGSEIHVQHDLTLTTVKASVEISQVNRTKERIMANAILAPSDLATNISTAEVIVELEHISDMFNRKLGKLDKAGFLSMLDGGAAYYGVDATLIVMTLIDRMFADSNYNNFEHTYGIVNLIDIEILRMSK